TESAAERRLYEGFLDQLPDDYVVYHSIPWVLRPDPRSSGGPDQGEADFLIAHAVEGLLVIEVKGGELAFDPATRRWSQAGRGGMHILPKDPFQQASDEMHALMDILSHQPGWDRWRPAMGFAVAFPDGHYTRDAHPGAPAGLVIDHDDLNRLAGRVKEIMASVRARHP